MGFSPQFSFASKTISSMNWNSPAARSPWNEQLGFAAAATAGNLSKLLAPCAVSIIQGVPPEANGASWWSRCSRSPDFQCSVAAAAASTLFNLWCDSTPSATVYMEKRGFILSSKSPSNVCKQMDKRLSTAKNEKRMTAAMMNEPYRLLLVSVSVFTALEKQEDIRFWGGQLHCYSSKNCVPEVRAALER